MFIIVFATVGNLHHHGRAETWYGDGTFSVRAEQVRTETVLSKLVMGEAPRKIRKIEKEKNVRIKKIVQEF